MLEPILKLDVRRFTTSIDDRSIVHRSNVFNNDGYMLSTMSTQSFCPEAEHF